MPQPDGLDRLRGVARRLLWGALACLLVPALAWLGNALYLELAPPGADDPAGSLTAILALYLVPLGGILLLLGAASGALAWRLGRRRGSGH